jgi:hypothetical protein
LLHTQSLDWVVDDTLETLRNWENEVKEGLWWEMQSFGER